MDYRHKLFRVGQFSTPILGQFSMPIDIGGRREAGSVRAYGSLALGDPPRSHRTEPLGGPDSGSSGCAIGADTGTQQHAERAFHGPRNNQGQPLARALQLAEQRPSARVQAAHTRGVWIIGDRTRIGNDGRGAVAEPSLVRGLVAGALAGA